MGPLWTHQRRRVQTDAFDQLYCGDQVHPRHGPSRSAAHVRWEATEDVELNERTQQTALFRPGLDGWCRGGAGG